MSDRRLRVLWPLGPLPVVVPGVAVFAIVLSGTLEMYSWPYQEWTRTSSQFMRQLAVAGPAAAAAGTYYAGRLTAPSRIFAQRSSARPASAVLRRHLGLLLTAVLLGYLLALAPLVWVTADQAQTGALEPLSVLTGVAGLTGSVLLGYLVGAWGRSAVLAPATFVLVLGIAVAGATGLTPLSPVPETVLALGEQPSVPLYAFRLGVLVLVAVAAVQLTLHLLRSTSRRPSASSLAVVPVLAVAMVVPALRPPTVSTFGADEPRECRTQGATQYCVHAGHRAQLDDFVDGGAAVVAAYGSTPERVRAVHDRALLGAGRPDRLVVWPSVDPANSVAPVVATEVAATLAGFEACASRYGATQPQDVADFTSYLFTWLADGGRAPDSDGFNPWRDVPVPEVQRWIAAHDDEIATCSVDPQALTR